MNATMVDWIGVPCSRRRITNQRGSNECAVTCYISKPSEDDDNNDNRSDDLDRCIIFERIRYTPLDFFNEKVIPEKTMTTTQLLSGGVVPPVAHGIVLHNNTIENPTRPCSAFVNFANPNFGYVSFIALCTYCY